MNRTQTAVTMFLSLAWAGVAVASDAYPNPTLRLDFPDCDVWFQDGRSLRDIITRRLPKEECDMGDPMEPAPMISCYDPNSPPSPEMMAMVEQAMRGYQNRFWVGAPWFGRAPNTPLSLRWSFVPDGLTVGAGGPGGAGASELFSRMDSLFGGNRALWISKFQQCFDRWQALSGVTYTRVRSGTNDWDDGAAWGSGGGTSRGDVRISMKLIDGAGGILAYNSFPDNGDMVIDRGDSWGSSSGDYRWLRNVVMHEHGHGLGIAHVCPITTSKLMEPFATTNFDGPQQDDIRAVQYQNGDPYEPNNSRLQPYAAGGFANAGTITIGTVPSPAPISSALASVNTSNDSDWYSFTLDRPRLFNVTLTPIGSTYGDWQQSGDGSCASSGTNTNTLAMANLEFDIVNSVGTVMRNVDTAAAGQVENTNSFLCSPAGTFFVRVYASPTTPEPQSYRLAVQALGTVMTANASDGTFTDFVRITWGNNIPDANGFEVFRSPSFSNALASRIATLPGGTFSYDDTTAGPGTTYYYWIKARQPGNDTLYKYMTTDGDPGFRPGANQPPVADAGPDQTLVDADGNLVEPVTLDGSGSSDPDGTIVQYVWSEDGNTLTSGPDAVQNTVLALGEHTITLTVTDNLGTTDTDTMVVNITTGVPCPADYNMDGGVDGGDVESCFLDWQAGISAADVNQDGGVDGGDVETFFVAWEAGGC